jgi:glutamate synthase (NADPH/NADH) large chain
MSLRTRFKNLGNILAQDATQTNVFVLESPVLTNGMYTRMLETIGEQVAQLTAPSKWTLAARRGLRCATRLHASARKRAWRCLQGAGISS